MDRQLVNEAATWGVATRDALVSAGVSEAAVDSALRRGHLRLLHRGVYAVGHAPLRDEGRWLAAVLACGPGAVLSHTTAARLWGMWTPRGDAVLHVTLVAGRARPPGITVHRTRHLTGADVTVERGIRVTTPARVIVDCAGTLSYPDLRALADHGVRLDADAIRRAQQRAPKHPGAVNVCRLLGDEVRTRTELERALRRICRTAALPMPLFNAKVLGKERDAVWPEHRLVVEADGGAFHLPKPARENDYERDAALVVAGWRVVRFSYDQVMHEPAAVAARLAQLLGSAPART